MFDVKVRCRKTDTQTKNVLLGEGLSNKNMQAQEGDVAMKHS